MKIFKQCLTQERLKQVLKYDPLTGIFTRLKSWKGTLEVGCLRPDGYITISVDYYPYRAHRLAFLYMSGEFPIDEVDHKNMNRSDNRWDNLRTASKEQNGVNISPRKNNKCGYKNVYWSTRDRKWVVELKHQGQRVSLGNYDDLELADLVATEARNLYHGEYARHL